MQNERPRGMSLVELLVVLAIVGGLASLALPSYRSYVLRAGRVEARTALLSLAAAQEKFYLKCRTYAAAVDAAQPESCSPARLRFAATTERGYYAIGVTSADTEAWVATATRNAGTAQRRDAACRVFELTSSGTKSARDDAGAPATRECWDR